MAVPSAIFIDTCIFDAQKHNYETRAMREFLQAIDAGAVTLLIPEPIEKEIRRHRSDRVQGALANLRKTIREAPFLVAWKDWGIDLDRPFLSLSLQGVADSRWRQFLQGFAKIFRKWRTTSETFSRKSFC